MIRRLGAAVLGAVALACAGCVPEAPRPAPEPPPPSAPPASSRAPSGSGGTCAGILGEACAPGLYCEHPAGVCLRVADAQGRCRPRPQACTRIYQPVCGCDGRTYGNPCEAASTGTSVASSGECRPS